MKKISIINEKGSWRAKKKGFNVGWLSATTILFCLLKAYVNLIYSTERVLFDSVILICFTQFKLSIFYSPAGSFL